MCGSFGRFFLYRRESERTLPGGRDRASAGYIPVCIFLFWATDFTGDLGNRIFYFTGRCSGKSASWELCGDDWNECFGIAGVCHVSDPDGSRADRKGIRWIDGTWDCGNWFASGKSVAAFYGRVPAFFCCGSRYLSDWFGEIKRQIFRQCPDVGEALAFSAASYIVALL